MNTPPPPAVEPPSASAKQGEVRLGIIGLGNMGAVHGRSIVNGHVPGLRLAAVADTKKERMQLFPEARGFVEARALIEAAEVDAVLIATPHYSHTELGIAALERGLHVLVEKPISVHKADCERLLAAHRKPEQVFAAMFNQRTDPYYQKIRTLVRSGELGEIRRLNWTITNWFRTDAYYASGSWRATWKGEGGGVLLNQCPHNLDLFQWMFGMPARVRSFCGFGRYHDIEVEDDVTAYLEYANGATGVFITSTGEAPGTNRLEVVGERGRLLYEEDVLRFDRNETPMTEYSRTTKETFVPPGLWEVKIPVAGHGGQHVEIMRNFADAILHGAELIAPAAEGIHSVELANAMIYSTRKGETVELPLDGAAYEEELRRLVAESRHQ